MSVIKKSGAVNRQRMTNREYLKHLYLVFCDKYAIWFMFAVIAMALFTRNFTFGYNFSNSLPHKLYFINKNIKEMRDLNKGDYIAFVWQGDYYPHGTQFLKQIAGEPGDVVTRNGREYFVNGKSVGVAKEFSLDGEPLEGNSFEGVIPRAHLWVKGESPDSLDSRYATTGLVGYGQFIGKAYPLF